MKKKYGYYEYEIKHIDTGWIYALFTGEDDCSSEKIINSDEWFETEAQAEFACIGHIDKLEKGEF